ncbi:single-stranded DNA-binding protein [Bacillus sp. NPDC094106]|uniref:single-stranded DNA-binding protein n=1 Tax=Bacillus sp. NPDC094106 TaxID=3363949 RepID=UPI00381B67CB
MAEKKYYSFASFAKGEGEKAPFGVIEGRVTKEVEIEDVQNGKKVAKTSIVSQNVAKKIEYALGINLEQEESTFFNITGWEILGERMQKALHKGDIVIITGNLKSREYNGKTYFDLVARDFKVTRYANNNQNQEQGNQTPVDNPVGQPIDIADDDLPF